MSNSNPYHLPGDPFLPPGVSLRDLEGPRDEVCPVCEGKGYVVVCDALEDDAQWREPCRECGGCGTI